MRNSNVSDEFEYEAGEPHPMQESKESSRDEIDEYSVLIRTPDIVEEDMIIEDDDDRLNQSISIVITDHSDTHESMPSPSAREHRCCLNAIEAVDREHIGCLSGMASEGGSERDGRVEAERRLYVMDTNGETALHLAVRKGDIETVKLLLSLAPSLREKQSLSGETAGLISSALGHKNILMELLSGDDSSRTAVLTDINGTSLLMASIVRGDNETAMYLLEKFGKTVAMLPNRSNMLPIHVAAAQGNIDFLKAVVKVDSGMANFRDEFGCAPALYAVQGGCLSSLRFLIEKAKANLYAVSNKGQSLLHVACIAGHDGLVRYLISKMGTTSVTATTKDHANSIHCAAYTGRTHILSVLLGCFAKRKRKEVLAARDSRGNSPLHLAAIGNHVDTALFLVEAGAEPQLLNGQHQTSREVALIRGHGHLAGVLAVAANSKWKKRRSIPISNLQQSTTLLYSPQSRSLHDISQITRPMKVRQIPHPSELYGHLADPDNENYDSYYDRRIHGPASPIRVQISGRAPSSTDSYAQTSPLSTRLLITKAIMNSPHALSSGYSSAGESHENKPELTKRHLDYIDSSSDDERADQRESTVQTDDDELQEKIKHIDDRTWMTEGLTAVEAIDEVLKEVDDDEELTIIRI